MCSFTLKMIAIITMLIDHIGAIFIPENTLLYFIFRGIGRLAFPIFVFLIVEGFYHTSNIKRYLARLGAFALLSEIPFDIAFYNSNHPGANLVREISKGEYTIVLNRMMQSQNVFFTLFLGLLLITLINRVEKKFQNEVIYSSAIISALTLVFCFAAFLLRTDYSYAGILLIAAFYLFRGNKVLLTVSLLIVSGGIIGSINILATLSMLFISLYNGEKGKDIKYFFYIFYPAHLLLLYIVRLFF
ncbi:MAG: hypothetical protein E7255_02995 [Lachnospiraceae bacterium]|nr:hypothetical protein [Lachnospiraceae bacterium]